MHPNDPSPQSTHSGNPLAKVSSRLPGYYRLPIGQRRKVVAKMLDLTPEQTQSLGEFGAMTPQLADVFIENAIGGFSLPLGIATNFQINGKDVVVPMAVEESSVLAAASYGAKLARSGGGFTTSSTSPIMTGQIELFPQDLHRAQMALGQNRSELIEHANSGLQRLVARGGGVVDIHWRPVDALNSVVVYLDIDTREAMGANIVNTVCEKLSVHLAHLLDCQVGLRILTNLTDKRLARASCRVAQSAFDHSGFSAPDVVNGIVAAYRFAQHDVYRAATHNKGVMNGIDPVVIATGNDWRAIEAGAHAYSCRTGVYQPMTTWWQDEAGDLHGSIELPMAVGTVGGVTKLHPSAQAALKLLGSPSARELAEIICAVGLAQNLSALRALACEGIQKGHMHLHQKNLQMAAADASEGKV